MADLNSVETTVTLDGIRVHFAHLRLSQSFNSHHRVEIEIDHEEFGEKWMGDAIKMINFIGKDVNITFKMKQTGEQNLFAGIITSVSHSGYHGSQNSIVITGSSSTVKLDGKPAMDSFMDLPLQQIVEESVSNSGNGGSVIINPKFSSKLDYVCQYNESCWDFLNRLSWQFGEWFFYNGQTCYFGMENGKGATLVYDKEMTYFDLSANLVPQKFKIQHYLKHDDKAIDKEDPSDVPGVHGYLQVSKGRSESVYTSDVTTPLIPDVNTKKDLDDLVKAEKSRAVGEMLIIRGKSQTCKVKIGGTVKIEMPEKMEILQSVDTFLVTEVTHIVDQEGNYSNSFSGIIDGIEAVPMAEPKIPVALSQIATVKDNADPRNWGRVKVETQWQKEKNKTTNWIRVQTPDAGKSDKVGSNRGLVTIPETGDTVMLGFEYGSPDRPFVAGSVFTSQTGGGGGAGNKAKSLTTRSGSTVTLDDEKGSVLIADQTGGDCIVIDGTNKISVTTTKTIELNNGQSFIVMEDDKILIKASQVLIDGGSSIGLVSAGETVQVSSCGELPGVFLAATNIGATADKTSLSGTTELNIDGAKVTVQGSTEGVDISGTIVKINS